MEEVQATMGSTEKTAMAAIAAAIEGSDWWAEKLADTMESKRVILEKGPRLAELQEILDAFDTDIVLNKEDLKSLTDTTREIVSLAVGVREAAVRSIHKVVV